MARSHVYGVLLAVAFAAANLPRLNECFLLQVKLRRWLALVGTAGMLRFGRTAGCGVGR